MGKIIGKKTGISHKVQVAFSLSGRRSLWAFPEICPVACALLYQIIFRVTEKISE